MTEQRAENLHLLSRNPVFSAAKSVWGYEIKTAGSAADIPGEAADVGASVIAGDYVGLKTIVSRNKKMLVAYTREQLEQLIPGAIPAQSSVILVDAACQEDPTVLPALTRMAAEGHTVALEWDPLVTPSSAALNVAAMVCLAGPEDAADPDLHALLGRNAGAGGALACLVRNVMSRRDLESLQAMGATLFQGRFFKTAEIIPGRRLSSHQNSRLQLLQVIEGQDPDLDALARTIQADVSLSYRLLTYLNSPAFGFMRKIDSIRQAISLLGWINVRNWLRAVLLADIVRGEEQNELLHLSLWRGKFLERTVTDHDYWDFKSDEMFLLGMFSLLDAILGIPMADALAFLPLDERRKKALRGEGTTEYAPFVSLMLAFEERDETNLEKTLRELNLEPEAMRRLHCEAGAWASSILEIGQGT